MRVQYGVYANVWDLPDIEMERILPGIMPDISFDEMGKIYTYNWESGEIICKEMMKEKNIDQINGFVGWLQNICAQHDVPEDCWMNIQKRVLDVKTILGIEMNYELLTDEEKMTVFLGKIFNGLKPMVFYNSSLFDHESKLILSHKGKFDETTFVG